MILKNNFNKSYALQGYWVWENKNGSELSPQFTTELAAYMWKDLIKDALESDKQQPETVGEECTCENCGCN